MQEVKGISAYELHNLMQKDEKVVLIDVREVYEHDTYNIGGKLIVLSEIMYHLDEIPHEGNVVVYCRKGVRSAIAIQKLQDRHAYKNLLNLEGGIEAWIKHINGSSLYV